MPILMSKENPEGHKLEDLLAQLQLEIQAKTAKIAHDKSMVAFFVRSNNDKISMLLAHAERLQRESYEALDQIRADEGPTGQPRIGGEAQS